MNDEPVEVLDQPKAMPEPRADAWAAFATAVQFLTRLPLPGGDHASPAALRRAPAYFPLVGALVGLATANVIFMFQFVWPTVIAILLALAIEARLTGALHEDAVADFCDAFGGGWTRDDVLHILKDSRVGTYGVLGLTLAVSLRAGAMFIVLVDTGGFHWLASGSAIVASAAIGRWMMVALMIWVPPIVERESLARDVAHSLTLRDLFVAAAWALPAVAVFAWYFRWNALLAAVFLVVTAWWFARLVVRRIGGMTGDCLGAIGYISQVLVLLAAAARLPI